jgi:pimeloyl-ACP methyl ester carboxylesterase
MAKILPRARFVEIPDAGHVAPLQDPDRFAAAVRDFLQVEVER